jgi:hypothetical protein
MDGALYRRKHAECREAASQDRLNSKEFAKSRVSRGSSRVKSPTSRIKRMDAARKRNPIMPLDRFPGNSANVANQIVRRSRDATFWPVKASELRINFFFGPRMKMGGGPTRNEPRYLHSGVGSGATV